MRVLLYLVVLAVCVSCAGNHQQLPADAQGIYCEDSAMAHFISQPERSLLLLDSAVILKTLNAERAQYLKAIVAYNGLKKPDSCIAICQQIIDEKAWGTLDDPVGFQIDVYQLMAMAAYTTSDLLAMQRYAQAGIQLAHDRADYRSEEADLLSRVGTAMVAMGENQEGIKLLNQAVNLLSADNRWQSVLAFLNISKKYVRAYTLMNDYEGVCRISLQALKRLNKVKIDYASIQNLPASMEKDSLARNEFYHYYFVPLTAFLSKAYTKRGMLDSAKVWYQQFASSPQNDNPAIASPIVVPLIAFGHYDQALQRIQQTKDFLGDDTLSTDFIDMLGYEQQIYGATNRKDEALAMALRIKNLTDSLNQREHKTLLANSMLQYKLQQEQLKLKDTEQQLSLLIFVILSVGLFVLMVSIGFLVFIYFQKEKVRMKLRQDELDTQLKVAQAEIKLLKEEDVEEEQAILSSIKTILPEEIYQRAQLIMESTEPFTDSKYSIDDLAQQVFTNRSYLSKAINQQSGMSFRNWLALYRVEYAKRLMLDNPNIKINKLATMCGFDSRNSFYRQFSNFEGLTPTEWLKKIIHKTKNFYCNDVI